jgi:hypothetical protein
MASHRHVDSQLELEHDAMILRLQVDETTKTSALNVRISLKESAHANAKSSLASTARPSEKRKRRLKRRRKALKAAESRRSVSSLDAQKRGKQLVTVSKRKPGLKSFTGSLHPITTWFCGRCAPERTTRQADARTEIYLHADVRCFLLCAPLNDSAFENGKTETVPLPSKPCAKLETLLFAIHRRGQQDDHVRMVGGVAPFSRRLHR